MKYRSFATGIAVGIGGMALLGAAQPLSVTREPAPIRPVNVVLHRFDMVPGQEAAFRDWIDMLHTHHHEAVATLGREETYFEAMFTAPDEPRRLYWLTVQGAGGRSVENSSAKLDRDHVAYMDHVLVKGSHRRLTTKNVLAPDFIVAAVRQEQVHQHR